MAGEPSCRSYLNALTRRTAMLGAENLAAVRLSADNDLSKQRADDLQTSTGCIAGITRPHSRQPASGNVASLTTSPAGSEALVAEPQGLTTVSPVFGVKLRTLP
jgi:hypothetical protein